MYKTLENLLFEGVYSANTMVLFVYGQNRFPENHYVGLGDKGVCDDVEIFLTRTASVKNAIPVPQRNGKPPLQALSTTFSS